MPSDLTISTTPEPARSECPPPLFWADVLARVAGEVRESQFERTGAAVTVRTFGQGRPLYVLGGGLGDWRLFSLLMWLLRDDFRVVLVDPPQARTGRLPRGRLFVEELAGDLFAAADRLGDDVFHLLTTSIGSLPGLQAMLAQPSRIEGAVLHAADSRLRLSVVERLLAFAGGFSRRPLASQPCFARIQVHNHRRWFPPFDESRWEFFLENIGATPTAAFCRRFAALQRADLTPRLGEITTPILLLRGEGEGTACAARVERLRAAIPNADSRFLPHCGHFPFLTHPHVLARVVKQMVSGER